MRHFLAFTALALCSCMPAPARQDAQSDQLTIEPSVPLTGRVTDQANLLSPEHEEAITHTLARLEANTHHQMVVVTVASLDGKDIKSFTTDLANAWGIGRKTHDDGVVLLVAPNEREMRIAVGYGLENTLTDEICSEIIEANILPHFRSGDMPAGIAAGVDAVVDELT